jgi:hypothetical protein
MTYLNQLFPAVPYLPMANNDETLLGSSTTKLITPSTNSLYFNTKLLERFATESEALIGSSQTTIMSPFTTKILV